MDTKQTNIVYRFHLNDGSREVFDLKLDNASVKLVTSGMVEPPGWARLNFHRCPHCMVDEKKNRYCPVAMNLVSLVERFDHLMSFERVRVEVTMQTRQTTAITSAQEAISSLMGLLIATSDCRHTDFFKPMARMHLPFASKEETIYRAISTYFMLHFYETGDCGSSYIDLNGLSDIYKNIQILNDYVINRIRSASTKDSTVNALVHLDVVAKYLAPAINDSLEEINGLFEPFVSERLISGEFLKKVDYGPVAT